MRVAAAERELVARFAALDYPPESFGHAEHVRLAWALLAQRPLLEAIRDFRHLLRAFAQHHGAEAIYNETITCFYLLLIRERMDQLDANHDWQDFRAANADLFGSPKAFLEHWYPDGGAYSPEAKGAFRLPALRESS